MDLKKIFAPSYKVNSLLSLIITVLVYIVVAAVLGFVVGLISAIPVLGIIGWILSVLVWIYEVVGIVLAFLKFFKVV